MPINKLIKADSAAHLPGDKRICDALSEALNRSLARDDSGNNKI